MDFFDPSGDGTRIDYNAFCRLCRYKEPEGLTQVQRLVRYINLHDYRYYKSIVLQSM